jgi:hypothetical protein
LILTGLIPFLTFSILGPPVGHSYFLNASWQLVFSEQFYAGNLYPRWLYDLQMGGGSPVFYFYGPFPFWVGAVFGHFLCWNGNVECIFATSQSVLLALSGLGFFYWARLYTGHFAAFAGAILYVFLPYHFVIDVVYRQALGEIAAYVWMPIILLGLAKALASPVHLIIAIIGYAGLIYSHLPSALLFSPVLAGFVLFRFGIVRGLRPLIITVVLGVGLAGLYIVPALTTQEHINISAWWGTNYLDARTWLLLSGKGVSHSFAEFVFPAIYIATVIGFLAMVAAFYRDYKKDQISFLFLVTVFYWFVMTYPSHLLWEHFYFLRNVQFPWRVGIVLDLVAATAFAIWLDWALKRKRFVAVTLSVATIAVVQFYAYNIRFIHWNLVGTQDPGYVEALYEDVSHGYDATEYQTVWYAKNFPGSDFDTLVEHLGQIPDTEIISGEGSVRIAKREIGRLAIFVDALTPVRIRFRRFYYPGWVLEDSHGSEPFRLTPSKLFGLIETQVPAGTHHLTLSRTAIREEFFGAAISIVSLIGCLVLLLGSLYRKRTNGDLPPAV